MEITFLSRLTHNPSCDIVIATLPEGYAVTYGLYIKGPKEGMEFMEYYQGENYVPKSKARNFSYSKEVTHISDVPKIHRELWQELKTQYINKYKDQ